MASVPVSINVGVAWSNPRCLKAMQVLINALEESSDAMPWRPELRRTVKAAKYLAKNMTVQSSPPPIKRIIRHDG